MVLSQISEVYEENPLPGHACSAKCAKLFASDCEGFQWTITTDTIREMSPDAIYLMPLVAMFIYFS
ncbi:hypothetical protein P775_11450 [Puniceibacterium antarcticum]|uniref:Uncharacterized protein n=1 Tax=Puniceibacterium antarcticum TaxID=1206336 RepID=A0A2G8RG80_9RHOB|nr:hypothetical protein P775_11450 [Puniceibacterium antarcticum]